ncbi:MAG: hypothetical protein AAGD25_27830 [Cyanobacteria bacterium P01_F01_bin.150]
MLTDGHTFVLPILRDSPTPQPPNSPTPQLPIQNLKSQMPLSLPNLDDRTYEDLVAEALSMIPTYAPEWTNHNPSDPGITLIELFAYLTEMLLYRQNRITDDNLRTFLRLLNGPNWVQQTELQEEIRQAVLQVRDRYRAVTCEDFEELAIEADARVARAHCVPRRNLDPETSPNPQEHKPGHISVLVVPHDGYEQSSREILATVLKDLEPRTLITTRLHVIEPQYVAVGIRLAIYLKPDAVEDTFIFTLDPSLENDLENGSLSSGLREAFFNKTKIALSENVLILVKISGKEWIIYDEDNDRRYIIRSEQDAKQEPGEVNNTEQNQKLNVYQDIIRSEIIHLIDTFLHPIKGGTEGRGWPFGRDIYVSEIYELLDKHPSVDHVEPTDGNDELIVYGTGTQNGANHADDESSRLVFDDVKKQGSLAAQKTLVSVRLEENELVQATLKDNDITIRFSRS